MLVTNDRELDALIDHKFFNVVRIQLNTPINHNGCPYFSSNPLDAWRLVEKLNEIGYLVTIEQILQQGFKNNKAYRCLLLAYHLNRISESAGSSQIVTIADSMPKAVALAALKAIEINESYMLELEKRNTEKP